MGGWEERGMEEGREGWGEMEGGGGGRVEWEEGGEKWM